MNSELVIRRFESRDEPGVTALWNEALPSAQPWNEPKYVIARKLKTQPELFFVGEAEGRIVATVMAGYDGVRGWIYWMAVANSARRRGYGRLMMEHAQQSLRDLGCPKVNLQVRPTNENAKAFYIKLGFSLEDRFSMEKRLQPSDSVASVEIVASADRVASADAVPTIKIEEGLTLSQITWSDQPSLLVHLNQTDVIHRHTMTIPYPYTEADARQYLSDVQRHTVERDHRQSWAIRDASEELIGAIGFMHLRPGHRAEIGYWLAQPFWGRGIATRAVAELCAFGFAEHGLLRVYAHVFEMNPASARVLEKAGFVLEGRRPKHVFRDGVAFDDLLYGRLRPE